MSSVPGFLGLTGMYPSESQCCSTSQAGVSGARKLQHIVGAEMSVFENTRVVKSVTFPVISCLF